MLSNQPLVIAGRIFRSRLLMGTGKFSSPEAMREALAASGSEIVTVALRRADLTGRKDPFANILEFIDPAKYLLLPNTSGAMNAEEAVRLSRLAAAAGLPKWVKLEIHPDPRYLLPDPVETLKAAEILVKEGFTVLPYINADPVLAKRLQDAGAATVMPLGSPIGSNRGLQTKE
ncbi:MAG TPA: thiazole synthase, partial [Verrucomicrobiae bacterium]|nr:thiazole synthase [Verrucomicrobiae bacterium]